MPNVHLKIVWKYAEIPGDRRKKPAKTGVGGKSRKEAEKLTKSLVRDQKAVGERAERQHSVLSGEAGREANESIETSNATAPREQCED